jgi:hypothetical protein
LRTVFTLTSNSRVIAPLVSPSAAASTIRARNTARTSDFTEAMVLISRSRTCESIATAAVPARRSPSTTKIMAGRGRTRQDGPVPKNPPEAMQHHLRQRLNRHAREHRPHLNAITVRFRAGFAYAAAEQTIPPRRLRFTGVLHTWGFALYLASNDSDRDSILPSGLPAGSPEEAPDFTGDPYPNGSAI